MKITVTYIRNLLFCVVTCAMLSSCGANFYPSDTRAARDPERKAFVEKKDGEVIEANEARLRMPLFKKSTIELDGGVKIPLRDVRSYQNNEAFYYLTPGGLAPRITRGLINMYRTTEMYTTYEGGQYGGMRTRSRTVYYVQKGNDAPVSILTANTVRDFVADYAPAKDYMDVYFHTRTQARTIGIINTAAVLGGFVLMGASGNSNALLYTGGGLAVGGIVNGFVNKIRKGKNQKNIILAIDEYNMQTTRPRRR